MIRISIGVGGRVYDYVCATNLITLKNFNMVNAFGPVYNLCSTFLPLSSHHTIPSKRSKHRRSIMAKRHTHENCARAEE
jgi:hypothetical protein